MKTVNRILIFSLLICLLIAGSSMVAFATNEYYAAKPLDGSKGQISKDSSVSVGDSVFLQYGYQATTVRNIITFRINEYSTLMLPDSFEVHLVFKVYYSRWSGSALVSDSTGLDSLIVTYNKFTAQYTARSIYNFTGGYIATVKIFAVNSTKGNLSAYVGALMLDNEIWINRDYSFSCTADAITTINEDTSLLSTTGELRAFWNKDRAADQYDLEWTYIDSSAIPNYYVAGGSTVDPRKIFANNSTRVTISSEQYRMPLLYDNTGSLFFRVRSVKVGAGGQRFESRWSSEYAGGLGQFDFKGHERLLNWQATTSFAEEGKRKSVVLYFDGGLRSRQTVTRDNTTDTTMVAETFYDYQGRPVIQVLPTPSLTRLIKYNQGFNIPLNGAEYDRTHYDTLIGTGPAYCDKGADSMVSTSGASRYYSSNNPNVGNGFNKYIPNAKGYPFSETRYTQDNTGRLSMQGGVGYDFQIGRSDPDGHRHETRYYYLSANQEDLDALFGTETGIASHYFKSVVRDANGQYSVSYTDMNGKTVATALAGKPTQKLDTLAYNQTSFITRKLIDSTNNMVKGTSITASKSLIVTKTDSFRFVYSLMPDSISLKACDNNTLCYDCKYDLTITISDDCNNGAFAGIPVKIVRSNLGVNGYDTVCNANTAFPGVDTTLLLQEGSYTVTKTLTVNQQALNYYRDSVFLRRNTCSTLDQTIQTQKTLLQTILQCYPSCQSCTDSLGTWSSYQQKYMSRLGIAPADSASYRSQAWGAYNDQKQACDQLCNNSITEYSILQQMLADVTPPGGQYANPNAIDNSSIFSKDPAGKYVYQEVNQYVDESGKPDYVTSSSGALVKPQDLSIQDFIANFKSSWADSLLPKHPEYCKLQVLQGLSASNTWDVKFQSTDTYSAANSLGYFNPTANSSWSATFGMPTAANQDPFYGLVGGTYKQAMEDSMTKKAAYDNNGHFTDIWSLATMMAHCDPKDTACHNYYKTNLHPGQLDPNCTGEADMAWRYFREMYLQEKKMLVVKYMNASCPSANVPSGHMSYFGDPTQAARDQNTPTDSIQGHAVLKTYISDNCNAYVQQWWSQLAPCGYTSADSAVIIPRLIQVCKEGGDSAHAYGSSSVAPGSTYRFRTFDDVIKQYSDSTGKAYNATCNSYLITAPAPYDKQPVYASLPVWGKPDSCQCNTINTLYTQYQQSGGGDANFSAYLLRTQGISMSQGSLDTLRNLCNGVINCRYIPSPINLPPALQCGVQNVCASCTQVATLYGQFKAKFPSVIPAYDDTDSTQRKYNQLFENYMNTGLGFSKRAWEYLKFMDTCGGITLGCDELHATLLRYRQTLKSSFAPFYYVQAVVNSTLVSYTGLPAITRGGYIASPDTTTSDITVGCTFPQQACFNGGYTTEFRVKFDSVNTAINPRLIDFQNWVVHWQFLRYDKAVTTPGIAHGPGIFLASIWDSADATCPSCIYLVDSNLNSCYNWNVIKTQTTPDHDYIYYNGKLIYDLPRSLSRPNGAASGYLLAELYGKGAKVDWIKSYDPSGKLVFFDDYNDPNKAAFMPQSLICNPIDFQANFTQYFNNQRGTSYTYSQLDSLYFKNCGDSSGLAYPSTLDTASFAPYCTKALKFDGATNRKRVIIPVTQSPLNLGTGTFTLEARVKPASGASFYPIICNRITVNGPTSDGFMFGITPTGNLLLQLQGCPNWTTLNTGGINIFDGKAHFATVAKGPDSVSFYLDGVKLPDTAALCGMDPTTPYNQRNITTAGPIYIGYDSTGAQPFPNTNYSGWINEVRIWNMPRTQTDVVQSMNVQVVPQLGLVGYYAMADTDSCQQTVRDYSTWMANYQNNGYRGSTTGVEYSDPVWLSQAQISYTGADPTGIADSCKCGGGGGGGGTTYSNLPNYVLCGRADPVFPPVLPVQHSTCDDSTSFAVVTGTLVYNASKDSILGSFTDTYLAKCLKASKVESFTVRASANEYHYTLYYYDQAGNLVKTVPPAGVNTSKFAWAAAWRDSVALARQNRQVLTPVHTMATVYKYNTLNQVVSQQSPDGGLSQFWYDRMGRLTVSQNGRQKAFGTSETNRGYSYTLYDFMGRITEIGQIRNATTNPMTDVTARSQTSLNTWITNSNANKEQIIQTVYDLPYTGFAGLSQTPIIQRNLRNRASYSTYSLGNNPAQYNQGSFYTYDILGNLDTLVQDYGSSSFAVLQNVMNLNGNRFKKIVYRYDLMSGKMNHVAYQPNQVDQLFHRYTYDAENRIVLAETSRDSVVWEKDARYQYYQHGPLARTVIGDQMVQGLDYVYTLQGWVKGVNSTSLTPGFDMGNDGSASSQNRYIAKDAYSFSLNYFTGEYTPINSGVTPFPGFSGLLGTAYRPLYNGNSSSMTVNIGKLYASDNSNWKKPLLYNYSFDQLNRLTGMDAYYGLDQVNNAWSLTQSADYKERIAYDPNGNILKYLRNNFGNASLPGTAMDSLNYFYTSGTNKLLRISDNASTSVGNGLDLQDQPQNNYAYDEIGDMIGDSSQNIPKGGIQWNVYGKIIQIDHSTTTSALPAKRIVFGYDAAGNRISKKVTYGNSNAVDYTWYVRDGNGNVMATYTAKGDTTQSLTALALQLGEMDIYGNRRLGLISVNSSAEAAYTPWANRHLTWNRGIKQYELGNHLGNVMTTISDRKFGVPSAGNSSLIDYFNPEVVAGNDYAPFGMLLQGRNVSSAGYRYGFNGKEKDDEVKGPGDQIDYGMRVYDPRAGRFLSVDPLQKRFAYWTPYQFSANSPIIFVDMDGLEPTKNYLQWTHVYNWARKDYHDDDFDNYFKLNEKDKYGQPYVVRTRMIGSFPYLRTQFQYYDREQKDYFYFNPVGFEPEYIQNLRDLKSIGEFGKTLEKLAVLASLAWSPIGRQILGFTDIEGGIDRHYFTSTAQRAGELRDQAAVSDYVKKNVLTVAVADVEDKDGNTYRLVSVNSAIQKDEKLYDAVMKNIKPNEIVVPNILGGDAHAEENLNEFARVNGLTVRSIDASRDFCPSCSEARRRQGSSTETETNRRGRNVRTVKPEPPKIRRNFR